VQGIVGRVEISHPNDPATVAFSELTVDEKARLVLAYMNKDLTIRSQFERLRMRAYVLLSMIDIQLYLHEFPWYQVGRSVYPEEDLLEIIDAIGRSTTLTTLFDLRINRVCLADNNRPPLAWGTWRNVVYASHPLATLWTLLQPSISGKLLCKRDSDRLIQQRIPDRPAQCG
jgi:hypothetical protein